MSFFTDSDLQGFGDLAVSLAFRDSGLIERYTRVPDPQGGHAGDTWFTVVTVPCMVSDIPTKTYAMTLADRTAELLLKRISMPRLTDVRIADRITTQGVSYTVVSLLAPESYEVIRHVTVSKEV